jgi:hypothetical protein
VATVHSTDDTARLLELSAERDLWLARLLAAEAAAYKRGWDACLDRFADLTGGRIYPAHPTDIEVLRYGPLGREHFADPRPGDFPGRAA